MRHSSYAEIPSDRQDEHRLFSTDDVCSTPSLGRAERQSRFKLLDLLAFLISCLCLVVSLVVVIPHVRFAWQLGYRYQITIIGFALSIQDLCTIRLTRNLFVVLEARHGPSLLQNYDAILRNTAFSRHMSHLWRILIILFTILPLGLSLAYKQFIGLSTRDLSNSDTQPRSQIWS